MAFTKLYLTDHAAPYTPATIRGTWDDTAGAVTRALDPKKAGNGAITSVARAETSATNPFRVLLYRGVSGPLAAQTIGSTLDILAGILEGSASADFNWQIHAYVTQGNSDTPRGTLLSNYTDGAGTNEWPTTATGKQLTAAQSVSSLAISDGDRLVVEIGYIARNAVTTSFTGTLRYGTLTTTGAEAADLTNGSTSVTTQAGFLSFGASIAEYDAGLLSRATMAGAEVFATHGVTPSRVTVAGIEIVSQTAIPLRATLAGVEVLYVAFDAIPDPTGGGDIEDAINPLAGGDLCGAEVPVGWLEITPAGSSTIYRYAKVPINTGDPKEPRVKTLGRPRRALTNRTGELRGATVDSVLIDSDRVLRDLEATDSLINARVNYFISTEAHIRARHAAPADANAPRRVFSGMITNTEPLSGLLFAISAADDLAQLIDKTVDREAQTYPQDVFDTTAFPNLGNDPNDATVPGNPELLGKPVPKGFGILSDETIVIPQGGVVLLDATQGYGGSGVAPYLNFGWGTLGGTAPSDLTLGQAGGGVFMTGNTVRVLRTAVIGGIETDPYPLNADGQLFTFSSDNQKLTLAGSAVGGASAYRWYVNVGGSWGHTAQNGYSRIMRETASPSADLTDPGNENTGPFPPPDTNWTGAHTGPAYALVIANTPTGLTVAQTGNPYQPGFIKLGPWLTRPIRVGWEAFGDATEYWVFIVGVVGTGGPVKKFIVASGTTHLDYTSVLSGYTLVDSVAAALAPPERTGICPSYFVGRRLIGGTYKDEFCVFGNAPGPGGALRIYGEIGGARQAIPESLYGVNIWAPGHEPSWSALTGSSALYRDYGGGRYFTFFAEGAIADSARQGRVPFTVNCGGIEDRGDSTGNVITSLALQILYLLNNYVVQNSTGLAQMPYPTINGYSLFDVDSFRAVKTWSEVRISGGHQGAFIFGHGLRALTLSEIVKLAHDHGIELGFNKDGQIMASAVDPAAALVRSVRDVDDAVKKSFHARRRRDLVATRILYRLARRYAAPLPKSTPTSGDLLYLDSAQPNSEWSIDRQELYASTALRNKYGRRTKDISFELVRHQETADDLAAYHRDLLQAGPIEAVFSERLCATNMDLGDRIALDHFEGLTATGYVDRSLRVEAHTLDMDRFVVETEHLDLDGLSA